MTSVVVIFFIINAPVALWLTVEHLVLPVFYLLRLVKVADLVREINKLFHSFIKTMSFFGWMFSFFFLMVGFYYSIFVFFKINLDSSVLVQDDQLKLVEFVNDNYENPMKIVGRFLQFACFSFVMCMYVWVEMMIKTHKKNAND